ncbi:uncharacterized protein LOC110022968 [Phalaenopsis equestris]|uniref:uncharacterized protein LOC110022968 n=1 Tax=Phalaenopsis equestris TaxID=78828 RepID=UPI0009E2A5E4|nr:uncharacterized protein LOC110022968 [Phalaenopsis equestris]
MGETECNLLDRQVLWVIQLTLSRSVAHNIIKKRTTRTTTDLMTTLSVHNYVDDWILDSMGSFHTSSHRELMQNYIADNFGKVYLTDEKALDVFGSSALVGPRKTRNLISKAPRPAPNVPRSSVSKGFYSTYPSASSAFPSSCLNLPRSLSPFHAQTFLALRRDVPHSEKGRSISIAPYCRALRISNTFFSLLPFDPILLLKFKNKWNQLKKDWKLWKELKRGSTGFGWDLIKRTVDASKKWWAEKLEAVLNAKKFKVCGIDPKLEDKLDVMFKGVVAMGHNTFNPSELGFDGISLDLTPDPLMGSGQGPSINPRELESTGQSKRRMMEKKIQNKDVFVQSSVDRLIEVFAAPQPVEPEVDDPRVDRFMNLLEDIFEVMADNDFFLKCVRVLECPTKRHIFKRLWPELHVQYLRLSIKN